MAETTRRDFIRTTGAGILAAATAGAAAPATQLAPPDKQPPDLRVPKPKGKTVGWAIVGLGNLALNQVMPAFAQARLSRPVALVSGHPEKAKQVAAAYGLDPKNIYTYENYDAIAENPQIEAVYNILPNHMHAEYTIRAHKAGKHVLCEKPMAANVKECDAMIAAAKQANRKLMIAYRLHYEPYNLAAIEMCRSKQFGPIVQIEAQNCQNTRPPNIRLSKATAGGPLGDIGVYCLNACRYLTGEEPVEVTGYVYQPKDEPRWAEVPRDVTFTLHFASGVSAVCGCSFGAAGSKRYRVVCTEGYVDMENAYGYSGQELRTMQKGKLTKHDLPRVDHFAAEMDHFSDCILNDKSVRTAGEEGLQDIKIIAAIEESARTGKRVQLA
jgi:predicted dehydrogenase